MIRFERWVGWLSTLMAILAALSTVVLMFAITADVFSRWSTGRSLPGMIELSETSLVCAVFFGMAYAGATNAHISVTLLTDRLPEAVRNLLRAAAWALVSLFLVWITYATSVRAWESTEVGEIRFGLVSWPLWPSRWFIVIGLAAMLLVAIVNLARAVGGRPLWGESLETDNVPATALTGKEG